MLGRWRRDIERLTHPGHPDLVIIQKPIQSKTGRHLWPLNNTCFFYIANIICLKCINNNKITNTYNSAHTILLNCRFYNIIMPYVQSSQMNHIEKLLS